MTGSAPPSPAPSPAAAPAALGDAAGPWRFRLLGSLGLVLLVLVVFQATRTFGFMFYDDDSYILENPWVRAGLTGDGVRWALTGVYGGYWAPLLWLSYMLDVSLFRLDPAGLHLVNVELHALNAVLLFWVLATLTVRPWLSLWVAALWSVHPLNVGVVSWLACRKDLLCMVFALLALLAYAHHARRADWRWYALAVAAFGLGLLAKPLLVVLPGLLLLLDVWPLGRLAWPPRPAGAWLRTHRRVLLEKLPFLLPAVAIAALTLATQTRGGAVWSLADLGVGARLANAVTAYVAYLGHSVWFGGLAIHHPYPAGPPPLAPAVAAALALAAVSAAVLWRWRAAPALAVGWCWFLGALVPVIGLVQSGPQALADRFMYLPLIGVLLAAVWLAAGLLGRRPWLAGAAAVLAVATLVVAARRESEFYASPVAAFSRVIAKYPDDSLAYLKLGDAYARHGTRPALQQAVTAYRAGVARQPTALLHNNLGVACARLGDREAATAGFAAAIRLDAAFADAYNNLGNIRWDQERPDEARTLYLRALAINPNLPTARENLNRLNAGTAAKPPPAP